MADLENIMSVASADIHSILGVARADINTVMGVTMPSLSDWKGTRAIIMGGFAYNSGGSERSTDEVQYKTLTTDGNTADFGDLSTSATLAAGSGSNGTRVVMGGGRTKAASNVTNLTQIDYIVAASVGTVGDAGDLNVGADFASETGASNGTLCFFVGGTGLTDNMEQMNISTTGGSTDAGDIDAGTSIVHSSSNGDSKFLILGIGYNDGPKTAIDEHNFSTSADSSGYGEVASVGIGNSGVVCATNRVVTAGGFQTSGTRGTRMQFFPVASAAEGDADDEADIVAAVTGPGGTSDGTRGEWYGGYGTQTPVGFFQNDIQKVTIASLSNATDIGDLTTAQFASDYYEVGDAGGIAAAATQTA